MFTNVRDEDSSPGPGGEEEQLENYDTADTESESNASVKTVSTTYTKKRKRSDDNPLLESATSKSSAQQSKSVFHNPPHS